MKKTWLPFVLCIGFIVAWQFFVVTPYNKKNAPQSPASKQNIAKQNPEGEKSVSTQSAAAVAPSQLPQRSRDISPEERSAAQVISLGPSRSVKVFPNGSIGEVEFKDYKVRQKTQAENVVTIPNGIAWTSSDPSVNNCLQSLQLQKKEGTVLLSSTVKEGSCELRFVPDSNRPGLVAVNLTITGFASSQGVVEFTGKDKIGTSKIADEHNSLFARIDGSREKIKDKALLESKVRTGKMEWISWGDKYFASVFLPKGTYNPNLLNEAVNTTVPEKIVRFGVQYPLLFKDGAKSLSYELDMFFGTKDPETLSAINPTLHEAIELGIAGSVARLMLWSLKAINKFFGAFKIDNFGFSIIVLTLLVRLVFWPLNKKVFESSLKMKELAPEMERIKKKYGNDRSQMEALNREMLNLYRTNKVNPFGSCMPLLLQMPIFIGLYGALSHSLDLYQAPFFGWIHDLSSPDPYYILSGLWTITLLAYVKLNPTPQQPGQPDMKWIMIGMNLFFGFLSKDWPSGLNLYLFVSNLVGITQQYLFQRSSRKLQPIQEGA